MARELAISTYLFLFRVIFAFFKLFPKRQKTVCVASFGDNIHYTARALRHISDDKIIVLKDPNCNYQFDLSVTDVLRFNPLHPFAYLQSIYHLATASTILIDNYFGFLAVTNFKKGVNCIQLWHAAGALKQFGLMDPSIRTRNPGAKERFHKVYSRFHYTVVGSEKMADIFKLSFGLSDESIIRTGIPRTDIFFSATDRQWIRQKLKQEFPVIKQKKVILYAPTFRDDELKDYHVQLDFKQLFDELSDDYVLFIKNHPAVTYTLDEKYNGFVVDVSNYDEVNHLMLISDLLITDYSSIPCEYALLNKPMIFYAYDLQEYKNSRGLLDNYQDEMPGPIAYTTEDIIRIIERDVSNDTKTKAYASLWNSHSKGNSSMNLALFLTGAEKKQKALV